MAFAQTRRSRPTQRADAKEELVPDVLMVPEAKDGKCGLESRRGCRRCRKSTSPPEPILTVPKRQRLSSAIDHESGSHCELNCEQRDIYAQLRDISEKCHSPDASSGASPHDSDSNSTDRSSVFDDDYQCPSPSSGQSTPQHSAIGDVHVSRLEPQPVQGSGDDRSDLGQILVKSNTSTTNNSIDSRGMVDGRNEDQSQSSRPTSVSLSNSSQIPGSSYTQTDNPSTERKNSDSDGSSSVSGANAANRHDDEGDEDFGTDLERLIKGHVLHPVVARGVYQKLKDELIYAPPEPIGLGDINEMSLMELLEHQEFSLCPARPARSVYSGETSVTLSTGTPTMLAPAPPTSSGAPGPNASQSDTSSSNEPNRGSGNRLPGKDNVPPNGDPNQQIKRRSRNAASSSSQPTRPHPLRCPFNAFRPDIFRTTHKTTKFRTCAGPGYVKWQHLREHQKNCHMKGMKENPPQCKVCQQLFERAAELELHTVNDDNCKIRCPDCGLEFQTKQQRREHQENEHPDNTQTSEVVEISEELDKEITKALEDYRKSYNSANGTGQSDPELTQWIDKNTPMYKIGRGSNANPKLRLGQWYINFRILFPNADVPDNPFYDLQVSTADLASEKFIVIFESLARETLREMGPLPTNDIEAQTQFFTDMARSAAGIASRTVLNFDNNRTTSGARDSSIEQAGDSLANVSQFAEGVMDNSPSAYQSMLEGFEGWNSDIFRDFLEQ